MLSGRFLWIGLILAGAISSNATAQDVQSQPGDAAKKATLVASMTDAESFPVGLSPAPGFSSSRLSSSIVSGTVAGLAPVKTRSGDSKFGPFSTVAVGIKMSSLGAGIELATPLSRSLNLRGSANLFDFSYPFVIDGANYDSELHFRSGQASVDWFPFHRGFHISPGVLVLKNQLYALASVPAGAAFSLGDSNFTSSTTDPVHGSVNLNFNRTVMPSLMVGFGNLIPRSGRHFSVPFEVGVAYMGHPTIQLDLEGTACMQIDQQGYQGTQCLSTSDPTIQQNVNTEQADLNEALKRLQVYPIVSIGFSYRFGR